ncbi:MAG: NYN domain-containing protein [Nitrospiraceae bacterium]|nr:NYN domain-containing protein [Nitrospiraceae bacterium]
MKCKTPSRARLLIDGYNITGTSHKNLEKERLELTERLIEYRKRTGNEVCVVFDGWGGRSHEETREVRGGVNIIYSRIMEKADEVIKRMLEKTEGMILVSSDRELADYAWGHGSVPVASGLFYDRLLSGGGDPEEEWEEDDAPVFKGRGKNALSRREKAVQRALRRLF